MRSNGLLMIPGQAFSGGMIWQKCIFAAGEHLFNSDEPSDEHFKRKQGALSGHAASLRQKEIRQKTSEQSVTEFFNATYNIEVFAKDDPGAHRWLHELLKSAIIHAWTAYEVLAEDLWKGVVKKRPSLDNQKGWTDKQRGNAKFQNRHGIANFYRWTFSHDNLDIISVVDNPAIHALAILRNALVHSAGKIDERFQKDREGIKVFGSSIKINIPQLDQIRGKKEGYELKFNGAMVRSLVDPAVSLGFQLVKSVDEWLIRNP